MLQPFISTRTMVGLGDGLAQRLPPPVIGAALDQADLPTTTFASHRSYIPQLSQLSFFEDIAQKASVENIAFVLSENADIQSYGLFGELVTSASSFNETLKTTCDLMKYHTSYDRLSVRREDKALRLTYHTAIRHAPGYRHYATLAVSVMLSLAAPYFGTKLRSRIEFNFPRPARVGPYEELYGCPVSFDKPELSILFDPDAETRTRIQPVNARPTIADVARDAFGPAPETLASAVEALIRAQVSNSVTVDDVARQLDLSERTLRRRLNARGLGFRDIAKKVRIGSAYEYLIFTDLSIQEIAEHVGYSDASHFGRAFRDLTGFSPTEVRTASASHGISDSSPTRLM